MLPWAYPCPQPKWHLDWLSHFCTAHGKVSLGMPGHVLSPKNCAFAWCDLDPHLIQWFLRPTGIFIPNGISISSAVFAQLTAEHTYILQWATLFPSKLPLPMGDLDLYLVCNFLDPSKPATQMASRLVSHFCTSHGRVSLGMPGRRARPFAKNCAFAWGDPDPPSKF